MGQSEAFLLPDDEDSHHFIVLRAAENTPLYQSHTGQYGCHMDLPLSNPFIFSDDQRRWVLYMTLLCRAKLSIYQSATCQKLLKTGLNLKSTIQLNTFGCMKVITVNFQQILC